MTIMNDETREFVAMHRNEDVRELALKAKRVEGLDLPLALDQIAGWQIASKKLPQWASCEGIVYPPHISMEQCSSQFTAQYKSEIAQTLLAPAATVRAQSVRFCRIGHANGKKCVPVVRFARIGHHWWRKGRWWI